MKKLWKVLLVIFMLIAAFFVRQAFRIRLEQRRTNGSRKYKLKLLRFGDWASDVFYQLFMRPFRKPKITLTKRACRWVQKRNE